MAFPPQLTVGDLSQFTLVTPAEGGAYLIGYDRDIPPKMVRIAIDGFASVANLEAEAALARNADNLTVGTVPADRLSSDVAASKVGIALMESLGYNYPANAGTMLFATTLPRATILTVKTTTGYARLVKPDDTLGTTGGSGNPNGSITLTVPAGGGLRAFAVMSVTELGTTSSGSLTSVLMPSCDVVATDTSGLTGLSVLDLSYNRLTSFSPTGLGAVTSLDLHVNRLTSFSGTGLSNVSTLDIGSNRITSLSDMEDMVGLEDFYANNNSLTVFPTLAAPLLINIGVEDNLITTFAGAGFGSVSNLSIFNNRLTSFDSTGLNAVTFIYAQDNLLSAAAVDALFTGLGTTATNGEIVVTGNAAPTATSAAARAALISDGFTITTD